MVVDRSLPFVFLLFLFLSAEGNQCNDYSYWRHFSGTIPDDAVVSDNPCTGYETFIGTTYFRGNGLLPATLYPNDTFAYTTASFVERKYDKGIKILCAEPDKHPIWKQVNIFNLPENCDFIEGGLEEGYVLHIGRVKVEGKYYTGKVFPAKRPSYGLEIFTDKFVGKIEDFEILAYCC